jgi:protein-S-isoprenylcysteine O-methyltransferase Ste14
MRLLETKLPAPVVALFAGAAMKFYAGSNSIAIDPSAWRMDLGVTLAQASALLALAAVFTLIRARTTINPLQPSRATTLVTGGVFRFSRNPLYLSLLILLVAYAVRLDSLAVWLGPVLYLLYVTRFQIIPEERVLQERFGETFSDYRSRTRRWL